MRYTRLGSVHRGRMAFVLVLMLLVSLLAPMTALAAPAQSNPGSTEWVQVYTVERGDTLSSIALRFGVSEEALMQANLLRNADKIYVGQQLIIPEKSSRGIGGPQCASYHTVRRGDTLSEIALYNGIEQYALARANGIYDLNDVYIGQKLCIPGSNAGSPHTPHPTQPKPQESHPVAPQCNPCDAPKVDLPKVETPKQDGPQRPVDGPQRPTDGPSCNPCDGPKNDGPQRPTGEPQRPSGQPGNQPPCDACGGPVHPDRDKPHDDKKSDPLRPTEYWKGTYFKDKYLSEFAMERQDLEVNFNWMTGSPFGDSNEDRFSVRWEKEEYFRGGSYRFYAVADDGVRVYVDDQLIIDGWVIQPATEYKADIHLGDGPHKIVVEYYEEAEDAQVHVYWEPRRHTK